MALCLALSLLLFSQSGCESDGDATGSYWQASGEEAEPAAKPAEEPGAGSGAESGGGSGGESGGDVAGGVADAVPFGSLDFRYGGFDGKRASYAPAEIRGLRMSADSLSYSWGGRTLRAWGLSDGDHTGALACLFVRRDDGSWVGGKFDWISTSRTSRGLGHVTGGYGGWSLGGVPNPCQAAFVIVSADGKRRSNVISATWSR